jgi:hypothetical protein
MADERPLASLEREDYEAIASMMAMNADAKIDPEGTIERENAKKRPREPEGSGKSALIVSVRQDLCSVGFCIGCTISATS